MRRYEGAAMVPVLFVLVAVACSPTDTPSEEFARGRAGEFSTLALSTDGKTLASSGLYPDIQLWDLSRPSLEPMILVGHQDYVNSLEFSPDGKLIASGSNDETIRIWNLRNPGFGPIIIDHESGVYSLAFRPDGTTLASSDSKSIRLWSVINPQLEPITIAGSIEALWPWDMVFSPSGQTLATCGSDGINLWNLADLEGGPSTVFVGGVGQLLSCDFGPDGRTLASSDGPERSTIYLWDLDNPTAEPTILGRHSNTIFELAFSPDGRVVASMSIDPLQYLLWDVANPSSDPVIIRSRIPSDVTFSPDGKTLIAGVGDQIRMWDLDEIFYGETR